MSSAPGRKTADFDILQVRQLYLKNPNNSSPGANIVLTSDGSGGTFFAVARTAQSTLDLIEDVSGRLMDLSGTVSETEVKLQDISGIVYGLGSVISENVMVAGTKSGAVWYTTSGNSWSSVALPMNVNSVAWNGAMWLAGGYGTNVLMYSSDGLIWLAVEGFTILTTVNSVAWNGSIWIAVGINNGDSSKIIASSIDGITWSNPGANLDTIIETPTVVAWSGTKWLVGGTPSNTTVIASSTNGVSWIGAYDGIGITTEISTLIYNGRYWIAGGVGSTNLVYSVDAALWLSVGEASTFVGCNIVTVAWNGTVWVAGGNNINSGILGYSLDGGQTWLEGAYAFTGSVNAVAWNGSGWYASGTNDSGNPITVRSQDGITWEPLTNNISTVVYAIASRRPLPYIGSIINRAVSGAVVNTNQAASFTIYLGYSDTNTISSIYIPPGLMQNVPEGVYSNPFCYADINVGSDTLILSNTAYAAVIGMYGQGYYTTGWKPLQYIGAVNYPSYSVTTDGSITISNLSLVRVNGNNTTAPTTGTFTGYLATITLTYLTVSLL
jgi:hypothetical protein